jgi:deferrochelatase/peroxidase EfeB
MPPQLQEGIYHAPGRRPGRAFSILFLQAGPDVDAARVGTTVQSLWALYQSLKRGEVPDLPGHLVPSGELTCLLGYGVKTFELPEARRTTPEELQQFGRFRSPLTSGGGSLLTGSGQWYADDVKKNPATEIMAVQFIADTQLAVNRAVVETWKFLHDQAQTPPGPILHLAGFFQGFQRDDHRSWLDFHDGISNLPSDRREEAIVIKDTSAGDDQWTVGGTYMIYLRITVDLAVWRRLTREQQELHVGRDKLPGCPLAFSDGIGNHTPADGCPVDGTGEVSESGNAAFREPADVASESPLRFSHVQQVNHHRQDFEARDSLRVFRQGYEFLEPADGAPGFRAGLNFVSFQDTPERLYRILTTPGWLGRTNFGGNPDHPLPGMDRFLTVRAAGVYLVPPVVTEETFPGASILLPMAQRARTSRRATRARERRTSRHRSS